MLENSLFYPASGFDGDPVKQLGRRIHSFIYADYGSTEQELDTALREEGFTGYRLIAQRSVRRDELQVHSNWSPRVAPTPNEIAALEDKLRFARPEAAFCRWLVFERQERMPATQGAARFSLLYLLADGAAAYQALYSAREIAPEVLAIIQPGHGFGPNYTNFFAPGGLLHRSVRDGGGPLPEFFLTGHNLRGATADRPSWPEYPRLVGEHVTGAHRIFLWDQQHVSIDA